MPVLGRQLDFGYAVPPLRTHALRRVPRAPSAPGALDSRLPAVMAMTRRLVAGDYRRAPHATVR